MKTLAVIIFCFVVAIAAAQVQVRQLNHIQPPIDVMVSSSSIGLESDSVLNCNIVKFISDVPFFVATNLSIPDTNFSITGYNRHYHDTTTGDDNYVVLHNSNLNTTIDTAIRYIGLKKTAGTTTIYGWLSYQFRNPNPFAPGMLEYDTLEIIAVAWNTIPEMPLWMGQDCYAILADTIDGGCGTSTTLTVTGGVDFLWSTGETGASIAVTPLMNTAYTVTATGTYTCADTATVFVRAQSPPAVNIFIATDSALCPGDSIDIFSNAANDSSYQWLRNGSDVAGANTAILVTNQPGNYSVVVTNGCGVDTSNVIPITLLSSAIPNFSFTTSGDTAFFQNLSTDAQSYTWTFGDSATSTAFEPQHIYGIDGEFQVCLTALNSDCGTDSICKTVTIILPGTGDALQQRLSVYPNPAASILNVALNNTAPLRRIIISETGGKEVITTDATPLDIADLARGLYFITVELADGSHATRKVVLE